MTRRTEPPANPSTRRTEGRRTRGRSARVVDEVLITTAKELGRVGYDALRIDDVAERCGVNKTTIYRRWPTKADLVLATIRSLIVAPEVPDTGSLRADLIAHFEHFSALARSPVGRGVLRVFQAERTHPELAKMPRQLRKEQRATRRKLLERAIARGELPAKADVDLLGDVSAAPIVLRIAHHGEDVDTAYIEACVDLVLAGARGAG
jgi:AcrR family transcriptional regulator